MDKKAVVKIVEKAFQKGYQLGQVLHYRNPHYQTNLQKQIEYAIRYLKAN